MQTYVLKRSQFLPITVAEAWDFFSHAGNLSKITPPDMGFSILTELGDKPIYEGMLIKYVVRPLFGIPLGWTTQITKVDAPRRFTDKQLKGPYALWEHTHTFEAAPGGVLMHDEVLYALPLGPLGALAHVLLVKKRLEHIFDYRKKVLTGYFGTTKA